MTSIRNLLRRARALGQATGNVFGETLALKAYALDKLHSVSTGVLRYDRDLEARWARRVARQRAITREEAIEAIRRVVAPAPVVAPAGEAGRDRQDAGGDGLQ